MERFLDLFKRDAKTGANPDASTPNPASIIQEMPQKDVNTAYVNVVKSFADSTSETREWKLTMPTLLTMVHLFSLYKDVMLMDDVTKWTKAQTASLFELIFMMCCLMRGGLDKIDSNNLVQDLIIAVHLGRALSLLYKVDDYHVCDGHMQPADDDNVERSGFKIKVADRTVILDSSKAMFLKPIKDSTAQEKALDIRPIAHFFGRVLKLPTQNVASIQNMVDFVEQNKAELKSRIQRYLRVHKCDKIDAWKNIAGFYQQYLTDDTLAVLGGGAPDKVFVLGRWRKVYKVPGSRAKHVVVKGEKIKLSVARRMRP